MTRTNIQYREAQNNFLMTDYESFKGSDGLAVTVHSAKTDKNRYLILGTGFVSTEAIADEKMMHKIALEYAETKGYRVKLNDPIEYYYWGNSGYAFTVLDSKGV